MGESLCVRPPPVYMGCAISVAVNLCRLVARGRSAVSRVVYLFLGDLGKAFLQSGVAKWMLTSVVLPDIFSDVYWRNIFLFFF